MTPFEERVLQYAVNQINTPYIWKGKGDFMWSMQGPVKLEPRGYDCCGFVEDALFHAGRNDHRMVDNAQTEFEAWTAALGIAEMESHPLAAFYGSPGDVKSPRRVDHIALIVSVYGTPWSLQAAGGDHTTTTVAEALRRGAKVQFAPLNRTHDLLGYRRLPTL